MLEYAYKEISEENEHKSAEKLLLELVRGHLPHLSNAVLCHSDNGAPYLALDGKKLVDIYVSLSHSHLMCAAAISSMPVGIDIEEVRMRATEQRLISRFCSRLALPNQSEISEDLFFYKWTYTEACYKATGNTETPMPLKVHKSVFSKDGTKHVLCIVG